MSGISATRLREWNIEDFLGLFGSFQEQEELAGKSDIEEVSMSLEELNSEKATGAPWRKHFFESYEDSRAPARRRRQNPYMMGRADETLGLMTENQALKEKMAWKTTQHEELERKFREQSDRLERIHVENAALKNQLGKSREERAAEVKDLREKLEAMEKEKQKLRKLNGDLQDVLIYQHERIQGLRKEVEGKERDNARLQSDVANAVSIVSQTLEETKKLQNELQPPSTTIKAEPQIQKHQTIAKEVKPTVSKGAQHSWTPVMVLKDCSNIGLVNKEGQLVRKFVLRCPEEVGQTIKRVIFAASQWNGAGS